MSGPITIEREDGLAVVTLAHGDLNLFDAAVMEALHRTAEQLERDTPRAVLVRAEGRVVSGGVKVHEVFDGLSADDARVLWHELLGFAHRWERLDCPTVFAAHALCLTAAFEWSLACDLLLAAESARFGLVETVVGLTPAMGGTQRLAERAGPARAREFVMTGELYDAATLERWNVVNRVLPDEGFDAAARDFAARLAAGPTRAHIATKHIVRAYLEGGVARADEVVPQEAGALFATEDLKGAVRSFVEQGPGKATFQGR